MVQMETRVSMEEIQDFMEILKAAGRNHNQTQVSMQETQNFTVILRVAARNHKQTLAMVSIKEIRGAASMEEMM